MKQAVMMKQFKLNKTYFSLKESNLILAKELSALKEKNGQLKQKVKKLKESNLTKEEMKEMIKNRLITNVLIGKETVTVNAETHKQTKRKKKQLILKHKQGE
jgi:hypothetical protein